MHHSPSDGCAPKLIVKELKKRFLPKADAGTISEIIRDYLKQQKTPLPPNSILSIGLANHLSQQGLFNTDEIRRIIENRPMDFAVVVERSDWDRYHRDTKELLAAFRAGTLKTGGSGRKKRGRLSPKKRYELTRPYQAIRVGLIEAEFGRSLSLGFGALDG